MSNAIFSQAPSVQIRRSRFDMSYPVTTAFNNGKLIPLGDPIEVMPGDTFKFSVNSFVRLTPTINVPMSPIYCDIWWFFVPNRIIWNHWKEYCGENNTDPWTPTTTYREPRIYFDPNDTDSATVAPSESILSYMGISTVGIIKDVNGVASADGWINALKVRAYCEIWNSFFRSEAIDYPILYEKGDNDVTFPRTASSYYQDAAKGRTLLPLNRNHDYFSSCLPDAQFGDAVKIPLSADVDDLANFYTYDGYPSITNYFTTGSSSTYSSGDTSSFTNTIVSNTSNSSGSSVTLPSGVTRIINPEIMGTIDQFRLAYLTQHYLWKLGVMGHRYVEVIKGFFGVTAPDYLLDRPTLLAHNRFNINISPVVQTSASEDTTLNSTTISQVKGSVSGYSATRNNSGDTVHSFVEYGYLVPVFGTRTERLYCEGIHKSWRRSNFLDRYNPVFANIGSQPVFTYELYGGAPGSTPVYDTNVFGYNEAWSDYRYRPGLVTGIMRETSFLNNWTLADVYQSVPTLSSSWLKEGQANLNRALYVAGTSSVPQFLADFYVNMIATRPMPIHSVPGISPYF